MTDCLNASFYASIKGISSKQSLGMINLAAAFKESRQGLMLRLDGYSQVPESRARSQKGGKNEARVIHRHQENLG